MEREEDLFNKIVKFAKWYASLKEEERKNLPEGFKWKIRLLEVALKIDLLQLGRKIITQNIQEQAE